MSIIRMDGGFFVINDAGEVLGKFVSRESAHTFWEKKVNGRVLELADYYR
jgi:hypothetical protein